METIIRHLRRAALLGPGSGPKDAQLLDAFLTRQEAAAFEALVRRHGPLVLGVCRRVLGNLHDAEDAFQATFLVLTRKAGTVRPREMLGPWLYGVAYRTALKARAMNAKRRIKERQAGLLAQSDASEGDVPAELLARLDHELGRLPEKYRVPVILCELQGKSRREVARLLNLPEGTLSWRLAAARKLLARRISQRGTAISAAAVVTLFSRDAPAHVPMPLISATARAGVLLAGGRGVAAEAVSATVVTLTDEVVKTMLLTKLKTICVVALVISLGAGVVGWTCWTVAAEQGAGGSTPPIARPANRLASDELDVLRLEIEALRRDLQVTRDRVKTLETEVQTMRGRSGAPTGMFSGSFGGGTGGSSFGGGTGGSSFSGGTGGSSFGGGTGGISSGRMPGTGPAPGPRVPATGSRETTREALMEPLRRVETLSGATKGAADPLANAEAALKTLRQNPGDKGAADALEQALRQLKDRAKSEGAKRP